MTPASGRLFRGNPVLATLLAAAMELCAAASARPESAAAPGDTLNTATRPTAAAPGDTLNTAMHPAAAAPADTLNTSAPPVEVPRREPPTLHRRRTPPRRASVTVPVQEPVYQDLDRLDALGLLPEEVTFHRPLSRAEIARIVEKASKRAEAVHPPARDLLIRLRREYPVLPLGEDQGIEGVTIGAAATNSSPQPVLKENGIGSVDGWIRPLTGYHEGNEFAEGGTFWFETRHAYHAGRHLAFGFRTDMRALVGSRQSYPFDTGGDATSSGLDADAEAHFKALYGRVQIGNFILQAGRDALLLAPAPVGGILLSNNARPLDMVLVTHDSSYRLPWILRHLGPQRIAFAVADLGAHRVFRHSFLLVTAGTFRISRRIELGIWDTLVMGGEGAPKPAFFEIIHEIFPEGRGGNDEDLSDHRIAFDLRAHILPGRLLFYHEAFLEDGFRPAPLGDMMDVMSFRSGLYAPALGPHGVIDGRIEATWIPAITYRHGRWTTGYTLDGRILGDELGPDSRALRISGRWNRRDGNSVAGEFAYEGRDADLWDQEPAADPGTFGDIFRTRNFPTESRYRARFGMDWRVGNSTTWLPRLAVERVVNAQFTKNHDETNYLAELGLKFQFGAPKP